MPLCDLKCPKCSWTKEFFLSKSEDKEFCPFCKVQLEMVWATCRVALLNRSKPGSFKFDPKEVSAQKDMIHHFKLQEEQGGPKSAEEKKDTDYWYPIFKDKL